MMKGTIAFELIPSMKSDLHSALLNIKLIQGKEYDPDSFLDFKIFIALHYFELHIMQRVMDDARQYSKKVEQQLIENEY